MTPEAVDHSLWSINHGLYIWPIVIQLLSFNDGASDQLINLYDSKPKMTLNVMQGETSVSFESAKLTLGKYKVNQLN